MDALDEFIVKYLLNLCGGLFIAISVIIYRANKLRASNRAFSLLVLFGGIWTINYGFITRGGENAILHLRIGAALAAVLVPLLIVVRDFLLEPRSRLRDIAWRKLPWLCLATALAALTPLDAFIHRHSSPGLPDYGPLWLTQHLAIAAAMTWIVVSAIKIRSRLPQGNREELDVAVIVAAGAVAVISSFLAFHHRGAPLPRPAFGLVAVLYASRLTWVLLARGVYDTRVLLSLFTRTASIIAGASAVFFIVAWVLHRRAGVDETLSAIVDSVVAAALVHYLTQFFLTRHNALIYGSISGFQREVNEIARAPLTQQAAIERLEKLIARYTNTSHALLFTEATRQKYQRGHHYLLDRHLPWHSINRAGWIAPDTMDLSALPANERASLRWIDDQRISLLMLGAPSEHNLNVLVALGPRLESPTYTFYEIECLSVMIESCACTLTLIAASAQAQHAGQMMALGLVSASVAHEIKQPLAALRMFFKMLPSRCEDPSFREQYFHLIPDELARIESTLSAFLRLGRTESYQVRPFIAAPIIREVLLLVSPKAAAAHINVTTDLAAGDVAVHGDAQVLKQALLNLTLNAIQAMSDAELPLRSLSLSTEIVSQRCEISIRDTGPGLSPVILEKLFQPFVSTKEDGFGLGLYITRDQVVKTGGELIARNDPTGGACFKLIYPLAEDALPPPSHT